MHKLIKNLIVVTCALLSSTGASAAVDLLSMSTEKPLPPAAARQLLDQVFLHHPDVLDTVNVEITDLQRRDRYSVVFAYAGRGNDGFLTEVYVVTLDNRGFFKDGALLGVLGDVRCLVIDRDPEMQYDPSTSIAYDLSGDTIKVKRSYTYFSTLRGGYPYEKRGTIYNRYTIGKDGALRQLTPVATAIETRGNRPSGLPEPRDGEKVVNDKTVNVVDGEYYGYGMNVLMMMQVPVSAFDMSRVNDMAMWANKVDARPNSTDEYSQGMVAVWGSALCLRHANESLTWLAAHPDEDLMADCLVGYASEDNAIKAWLKQCVNNLNDKNARKWWLEALKKNGL